MFLSCKYEPVKNKNIEDWFYICQIEQQTKDVRAKSLRRGNKQFPQTVEYGSILGRKLKNIKTGDTFLALAVGHGQLPKQLKNDTF